MFSVTCPIQRPKGFVLHFASLGCLFVGLRLEMFSHQPNTFIILAKEWGRSKVLIKIRSIYLCLPDVYLKKKSQAWPRINLLKYTGGCGYFFSWLLFQHKIDLELGWALSGSALQMEPHPGAWFSILRARWWHSYCGKVRASSAYLLVHSPQSHFGGFPACWWDNVIQDPNPRRS